MVAFQLISLWVVFQCLRQKIPETYRIYKAKNVENISILSILLEEAAYTFLLTYNIWRQYSILTFLEYIVSFAQGLLVLWAFSKYSPKPSNDNEQLNKRSIALYAIATFCFYLLMSFIGLIPATIIRFLTISAIPMSATSQIVQLKTVLTNKNVSQINQSVVKIAAINNFARIITSFLETHDNIMVLYLFASLILNISIILACTVYKYGPIRKPKDKKKKNTT